MEEAEKARAVDEAKRKEDDAKQRALLIYLALLVGVFAASIAGAWWLVRCVPQLDSLIGTGWTWMLIGVVVFILCHLGLEVSVCRKEPMIGLWPFKQVSRFRGWLWSFVILGFVSGVVGNLFANRVQQNLDNQKAHPPSPAAAAPLKQP
jgi:dipeptide/tripeptide permease